MGMNVNIMMAPPPVMEAPIFVGENTPEWSTHAELMTTPIIITDPNHYYRALGFGWPFRGITRTMLRKAYVTRNGSSDSWMTYAFKQLLNDEFRRLYDQLPMWRRVLDQYVFQEFSVRANQAASERAARGEEVEVKDLLHGMGIDLPEKSSTYIEPNEPVVDAEEPLGDTTQNDEALSEVADTVPDTWPWGYYLWRSGCNDTERLERWQRLLLAASRELGLRARLCVGFVGQTHRAWVIGQLGEMTVIFLNECVKPDEALAAEAASEVTKMINARRNHGWM